MGFSNFDEFFDAITAKKQTSSCAVVAAESEATLRAVLKAHEIGIVEPLLIGNDHSIRECLGKIGADDRPFQIIPIQSPEEAAQKAVDLVSKGQADILMKGNINTSAFMSPIVNRKNGMLSGKMLSGLGVLEIPTYHKLLANSDGGITLFPTLEQKKIIIENGVKALRTMGVACPKVAVLAALETPTPKMPDTMDADALQKMNERGEIRDCIVAGPISYDLAINKESARIKGYDHPVAGDADMILFPDLTSGNLLGKALVFSGRAKVAGFVIGAKIPIVFTSRSAESEDKYRSLVIACALSRSE